MAIGGPPVAPSSRSWLGLARELEAGTPLLPTNTIPIDAKNYSPEDTPKFLPDEAIRGSMASLYNEVIGPQDATFSFGGPNFLDTHGFFLDNAFGDLSTAGSSPSNGTSLSGALAIGGTQAVLASPTGYVNGSAVQIDTGNISEVVVLSSAPSGGTITFANNPLRFPHASGATVSTVTSPFTHTFALLNSQLGYGGVAGAQPPTHSLTDNTNLNYSGSPGTNTSGARTYPGACVSAVDFTGNAEQLLDVKVTGNSWLSAPASAAPTNTVSSVIPVANWRGQIYIGGTAPTNLVKTIGEWTCSLKRQLQVYFNVQGNANPFIIARGGLTPQIGLNFDTPADETPLAYMLYQGYQYIRIVLDNGLTGASQLQVAIDAHTCQASKVKTDRNKALLGYANTFECVANPTDTGGSGGLGPMTIRLVNAVPTY